LGISQRELARDKLIGAANLIAFEKGRAWPRERTRHLLEERLRWPAGAIARIRGGAPLPESDLTGPTDNGDTSLLEEALQLALDRVDDATAELPDPLDIDYGRRAAKVLAGLHRLEQLAAKAVRHSQGSPAAIKALSTARGRYEALMLQAADSPGATLGQRLYVARRRANLTAAEAAAALGATTELIDALEAGQPVDAATAERIEKFIADWAG
jgi:transcriptional regulator with XRE-family HTH domain